MALIECPYCGKEVSDRGTICPHCREWLKKPQKSRAGKAIALVLLICMLCVGLVYAYRFSGLACRDGHRWSGTISTGSMKCTVCNKYMSAVEIESKHGENLDDAEEAYIYWTLDYYLTATDAKGKYLYSEDDAFAKVQNTFGVTREYLNSNIWSYQTWKKYSMYYSPATVQK